MKIKGIDGFFRMASLFVGTDRVGSSNNYTHQMITKSMDEYIAKKKLEGKTYAYQDIIIAALVRVFYLRPRLNRFVYSGVFYQRNWVDIAIAMQKNLRTGEQETTIKCRFTGRETLDEVKAVLDAEQTRAMTGSNGTDKFTGGPGNLPIPMVRALIKTIYTFDRWGWLSEKFMYTTSPFHSSIFFSNMKSIHLGPVWHHLYNFGNCGLFCSLGKDEVKPVVVDGKLTAANALELAITEDERFIDGLTFAHVLKTLNRMCSDLTVLERRAEPDEIMYGFQSPKQKKWQLKFNKRVAKIQAKWLLKHRPGYTI